MMIYRGLTIEQATFGHWNASRGDRFIGGFSTLSEAKRFIDSKFYPPTVTRVGPDAYRVGTLREGETEYRQADEQGSSNDYSVKLDRTGHTVRFAPSLIHRIIGD